jgi:hypothetical protein
MVHYTELKNKNAKMEPMIIRDTKAFEKLPIW